MLEVLVISMCGTYTLIILQIISYCSVDIQLLQILHLSADGHCCFSVSMSVNCTACPPPLVLKTLPWGSKEKPRTNVQKRIQVETHAHREQWKTPMWNQNVIKSKSHAQYQIIRSLKSGNFTLINLVSISPSEASSWCLSTYLWHLDRAFSFGADTLIALGMIGCMTVSRSKLEVGLWSTHFSPPADCERLCLGWTGGAV